MSAALRTLQIGFIVSDGSKPPTGSERYFWDLMRILPDLNIDAHGLVVGDPAASEPTARNVESFAPEGGAAIPRLLSLRRAAATGIMSNDMVASHDARHTLPVLDLIRCRPLVVHFHGPLVREGREEGVGWKNMALRALAERTVYPSAARVIALSRANAAFLEHDYHVRPERIRIVPGAVDLERFRITCTREEARRKLGWPLDRPIVVAVGRLAAVKGLGNLIDAMAAVRCTVPDVVLYLVGSGPLEGTLRARVEAAGLADAVRFAGRKPSEEMPLVYRAADMSVMAANELEGFGLTVIESLACGTPAMVTPVRGLPETIEDFDRSLIFEDWSPAAMAAGIGEALSGRLPLPSEEACVAHASRFAWPTIARRISDVYHEVMR
jgi:glycogen synthase